MRLITPILSSTNQPVNYRIRERSGETPLGWRFDVWVSVNGKDVGFLKYSLRENCLYIHRMDNFSIHWPSPLQHVGSLLFEYAFHKSREKGKGGRIELEAVGASAAAYFNMGFRKKSTGFIWLEKAITAYRANPSAARQKAIEQESFYTTLKEDAQAFALKKGQTALSFDEVLQYGEHSAMNDEFARIMAEGKQSGQKITSSDVSRCYMDTILYLPAETIAKKKSAFRFTPIGSQLFFGKSSRSTIKNTQILACVNSGELDTSNAVEIDRKLSRQSDSTALLKLLLSPIGLTMMKKNYISGWFAIMEFDLDSLRHILSANGLALFESNAISSVNQLIKLRPNYHALLCSDSGLKAFEQGALVMSPAGYLENAAGEQLDYEQVKSLLAQVAEAQLPTVSFQGW